MDPSRMSNSPVPPALPPKTNSRDGHRLEAQFEESKPFQLPHGSRGSQGTISTRPIAQDISDTHNVDYSWLPRSIPGLSTNELSELLSAPELMDALTHSKETMHPALNTAHDRLKTALDENIDMARRIQRLEAQVAQRRSTVQAQLLATHALERQWRQKQLDMDTALAPFSPAALYQGLAQGVQEQSAMCHALEESFLNDDLDSSTASERETLDWVRRYRETKALLYLRQERKCRWDEGRVGGWR